MTFNTKITSFAALCMVAIMAMFAAPITTHANPYALSGDHPTEDREYPTLIWCPVSTAYENGYDTRTWQVNKDATVYLSIHDNSDFAIIEYTIAGNTYNLLNNTQVDVAIPVGYYEGNFYAEDEHGNSEDRFDYGINFTTSATLDIVVVYQPDQSSAYDCAGIDAPNTWWEGFLPAAYGTQELSRISLTGADTTYKVPQSLISQVQDYAAETQYGAEHVDRWNRVLDAFGVMTHTSSMTAAEAQVMADTYSPVRWDPIVDALTALEASIAAASAIDVDVTAPVITLTGNTSVDLTVGDQYNEAGATCVDETDGAIPVTITGTVNTHVADTYTLYYDCQDNSGNPAISETRTVVVSEPAVTYTPIPQSFELELPFGDTDATYMCVLQ